MTIVTMDGEYELDSRNEIMELLHQSAAKPFDDIWVYREQEYPCLAILVNGHSVCIHYFLDNGGKMWQSIGQGSDDMIFRNDGAEISLPGNAITSLDQAIECAVSFAKSADRPDCITWREL